MKKILLAVFYYFIFLQGAHAEVFYSEYSNPILYEEKIEADDITKVEKEKRYLYYNETKILGDYYIEDENSIEYPYIDKTDFKETTFSDWTRNTIESKKNREIETRNVFYYQVSEGIRYVHFYNLVGSYYNFRIPDLQIYYDGEKIDYDYYCEGCSEYFADFINNGFINENMSHVANGGYLRIDLKRFYDPSKLEIDLYLYDVGDVTKTYTIDLTRTINYKENSFYRKTFYENFQHNSIQEIQLFRYTISDLEKMNPIVQDVYLYEENKDYSVYLKETYEEKRYKDILYRYYNWKRNYSQDYLLNATSEFPLKDDTQFKLYYFVSTREKVELKEPLIINQKNQTLEDLIKVNTTNEVEISWNGKYTHNDTYEVTYTFPFQTITRMVTVSIPENDENEEEISRLKEQIQLYEQKIEELEKNNENNISLLNELQNKIEVLQQDLLTEQENYCILEETKIHLEQELSLKKQDLESLKEELEEKVQKQKYLEQVLEENLKQYENNLEEHKEELKQIEKEMEKIEEEKNQIEQEIQKKEEITEDLQNKIENLTKELIDKKEEYSKLEQANQALNDKLKELIKEQEEKVINLENQKITYQESIRILQDQMELQSQQFSLLQDANTKQILEQKKELELSETKLEQQEALKEEYEKENLLKTEEISLLKEKIGILENQQTSSSNPYLPVFLIGIILLCFLFFLLKSHKKTKFVD